MLITPKELLDLSDKFKTTYGTLLNTAYGSISYKLTHNDTAYHVLISIPTLDTAHKASIYRTHPLPVYHENRSYVAVKEYDYVAIFHQEERFTPLPTNMALQCITSAQCQTRHPIYSAEVDICAMSNYFKPSKSCKYIKHEKEIPVITNIQDKTFILTPKSLYFEIKCNQQAVLPPTKRFIKITGIGTIKIPYGCYLINEDYTIYPNSEHFDFGFLNLSLIHI